MYWIHKTIGKIRTNNDFRLACISLIVLAQFHIFKKPIIYLINKTFIPIWDSISFNLTSEVILLIFSILITLFLGLKIIAGFSENRPKLFAAVTVGLIYIYFRRFDNSYSYMQYSFFKQIAYTDIIYITTTEYFILLFISYFKLVLKRANSINTDFYEDLPWEPKMKDILNRYEGAKELTKAIINRKSESSFSIGILGKWGDGKTSFLNMIETEIKNEKKVIIIKFNPWKSSNSQLLHKDFFALLKSELAPYSSEIYPRLDKYTKILFHEKSSKISDVFSTLIQEQTQILSEFESVNEAIKRINKQIIIFIDDMDRLDSEEIFEVVKLIRNTASFSNITFISAYDKSYISNSLKKLTSISNEYFIEKIFQQEITLPAYPHYILTNLLKEKLLKYYKEDPKTKIEIETKLRLLSDVPTLINYELETPNATSFLSNIRDVKRFLNSFIHTYNPIKEEIDVRDLFKLEILKAKAYPVYEAIRCKNIIRNNPKSWNKYVLNEDEYSKHFSIKEFQDYVVYKPIVSELFPPDASRYDKRSICFQNNFTTYFSNQLFNRLSRFEFNRIFQKPEDELYLRINEWLSKGFIADISDYLSSLPPMILETKDELFTYFNIWFYLVEKEQNVSPESLILYFEPKSQQEYAKKFLNGNNSILENFFKDKLQDKNKLFRNSEIVYKLLIFYAQQPDYEFSISQKELQYLALEYLKEFLRSANDMTEKGMWLYYHCVEKIDKKGKIHLIPEASKLMKDFIYEHPNFYINNYIRNLFSNDDSAKTGEPFAEAIFGSYEEFEKFLALDHDSPKIEKVRQFYEAFKAHGHLGIRFKE